MRWIFLTLVLVNVGLGAWYWMKAPQVESVKQETSLDGPQLVLLSEVDQVELSPIGSLGEDAGSDVLFDGVEQTQAIVAEQAEEFLPLGVEGSPLCTMIGPFEKLLKGEYLQERLASLGIESVFGAVEFPADPNYWVYLAPEISRKEALRRLHELQGKGIDSYVIPKGDLANGVSFGMFSRQPLAIAHQKKMIGKGYDAKIEEVERTYTENWLVIQPQFAQKLSEKLWLEVKKDNSNAEKQQNLCPPVALSENFP